MIVDLIVAPLAGILTMVAGWLPELTINLPDISPITTRIAQVDSLVPIAAPIQVAAMLLPLLLVFITIRFVLVVRHILLP